MEGFRLGTRDRFHDRDPKDTQAFDAFRKDSGVELVRLPPHSPHLNAYVERFVRSITEEARAQLLMRGERFLSHVIRLSLAHDHPERTYQDLGHQLMTPKLEPNDQGGAVVRHDGLGGWLPYDDWDAA